MKEVWKDVYGYIGIYMVSNTGKIKALPKVSPIYNGGYCIHDEIILKGNPIGKGYLQVKLHKNGKGECKLIHKIVAEHFIDNPNNLPFVNHKDENKQNNCSNNLEWCTQKYNTNYGTANARRVASRDYFVLAQKLSKPICMYSKQGEFIKRFCSAIGASRETGINKGNLTECANGKRKSAGGYIWKYEMEEK